MVLALGHLNADVISLDEAVETLNENGFDANDRESLDANARLLSGLYANRHFLADIMIERLKGEYSRDNMIGYTAQVVEVAMVKGHLIRAVIWPGESDRIYEASGKSPFVFDLAHDHDFHFLTTGYFGPGYWSRHFIQDPTRNSGVPGEKVELTEQGDLQLCPGDVHFYRAHVDVHAQLPAPSLSVSLNIVQSGLECGWASQFRYDLKNCVIDSVLNGSANEALLHLLPHLDGANGRDLVEQFAETHYSPRVRMRAWEALARAHPDQADGFWERAAKDRTPMVSHLGRSSALSTQAE